MTLGDHRIVTEIRVVFYRIFFVVSASQANKKTWAHDPQKTFSVWDISRTPILPGFDFIFCRDALQHLPKCMAAHCRTLDLNSSQIWLNPSPARSTYHGMPRG